MRAEIKGDEKLSFDLEWPKGLISSKRRLICLNKCVVRLVCLEQQWTVSVRGGGFMPLVALFFSFYCCLFCFLCVSFCCARTDAHYLL